MDRDGVQAMYDAWNEGNVDRMIDFWHPDGDWVWEDAPDVPDARVLRGRGPVEAHLRDVIELLGHMKIDVHEVTDLGEEVLASVQFVLRGAHSGVELEVPSFHVIRFEEGHVRRFRVFADRAEAEGAAGASGL